MKISRGWGGTQRLRREVTAVARRQTYKTFGVGHNSFQDTRHAQEVASCSWAAGQTICHPRWAHGVCWAHAHLEVYHQQHPQELASPRSCQSLFDCLRATLESTGRHGQDSLVESIHFPRFFHVQHQDPVLHAWLPQATQCVTRALQLHRPPDWRS